MSIRLVIFLIFTAYMVYLSFKKDPLYLLLLLVFVYFTYPEKYIWGLEAYRITFLLNIVLLVSVLYTQGKVNIFGDKYSILLVCLFFSVLISALFAEVNTNIAIDYAIQFLKLLIFWILLRNILNDLAKIELFYWGCLASLTFLAAWGVQQYVLGNVRLENFGGGQISGSNQLASALIWAVPIAYFNMLYAGGKKRKFAAASCLLILIVGIICTESRQAFLAMLVYTGYLFITSKRKVLLVVLISVFVMIGLNFVPERYFDRMNAIREYKKDVSAMGRIQIWKAAVNTWKDHPILGVGGKNYFLISSKYAATGRPRVTHNTFLQILSEEGLLGLSLFIGLTGIAIFRLSKIISKFKLSTADKKIFCYASIARLSLIGVLVCAIFQNKAEHEILYWSVAIVATLENIIKETAFTLSMGK